MVDKAKRRDQYLQRKYGITLEEYAKLLEVNDGGCWVCGSTGGTRPLHVDHNHKTGVVRGLLCWPCNKILTARWTGERLLAASNYIQDDGLTVRITLERE